MRITCYRHTFIPGGQQHHIHRPSNWHSQSIISQHHKYTNKHCDDVIAICSFLFREKIHSNLISKYYIEISSIFYIKISSTFYIQILHWNSSNFCVQIHPKFPPKCPFHRLRDRCSVWRPFHVRTPSETSGGIPLTSNISSRSGLESAAG